MTYDDMLRQTNRDALWALVALAAVVVVWLLCGFGLAGLDVQVFSLPLWVVMGLLGTWAAAIVAAVLLARRFKDLDLDAAIPATVAADDAAAPAADDAAAPAADEQEVDHE